MTTKGCIIRPLEAWRDVVALRTLLRRLGCTVFGHDWFVINDSDRKCLRCGQLEAAPWLPAGDARS
jgi:hypothetical protein